MNWSGLNFENISSPCLKCVSSNHKNKRFDSDVSLKKKLIWILL